MKRRWDQASIVRELKKLHRQGEDLSYNRLARKNQTLVSAAAYHFDSYPAAVRAAGIDYAAVSRRPRWTRPLVIKLIKQAKRAGDELHWAAVTRRADELGRAAFASLQKHLFGSWNRALHAAGLDADDVMKYRRWDKESLVAELKGRQADGEDLSSGVVQREDPGLHAAALRQFGKYDNALRAARVDPESVRRRRTWSEAEVLKKLNRIRKRGKVSYKAVCKADSGLYGAMLRMFGGIAGALSALEKQS